MESLKTDNSGNIETNNQQISDTSEGFKSDIESLIMYKHIREELEKFNDGKHFFVIHQTIEQNAINIMQSAYFSRTGLNGTSLIANLDTIINACYCLDNNKEVNGFSRHRGSDSLVIIILKKREFRGCRNLPDIDNKLFDYIESGEINNRGVPNNCVWGYVRGVSYNKNNNFNGIIGQ